MSANRFASSSHSNRSFSVEVSSVEDRTKKTLAALRKNDDAMTLFSEKTLWSLFFG